MFKKEKKNLLFTFFLLKYQNILRSFVILIKIGSIEIEYKAGFSINLSKKIRIKILQKVTSNIETNSGEKGIYVPQIREQMSCPDLYLFTVNFLALKNWSYPHRKYFPKSF